MFRNHMLASHHPDGNFGFALPAAECVSPSHDVVARSPDEVPPASSARAASSPLPVFPTGRAKAAARGPSVESCIEVQALRRKTGLSQERFAEALGISVHTLRNWEQRRRAPEGPARALLQIAARHPEVVEENLRPVI